MMPHAIWDFWSSRYERLWSQRFALKPARDLVIGHLDRSLSTTRPLRLLDMGCGVGQLARELACHFGGASVTAIDTSRAMVDAALGRNVHPGVTYLHAGIDELSPELPFDAIVATHAFPYLADKPAALVRLLSLLKPGGRLVLVHATIENIYDLLFMVIVRCTVSRANYHSFRKLTLLMQTAGFTIGTVRPMPRAWFVPSIYLVEGIRPI